MGGSARSRIQDPESAGFLVSLQILQSVAETDGPGLHTTGLPKSSDCCAGHMTARLITGNLEVVVVWVTSRYTSDR